MTFRNSSLLLCILIVFITEVYGESTCREGWQYFSGSCYGLGREKLSWPEAENLCTLYGGSLAEIHSMEENNFVKSMLTNSSVIGDADGVWIGGTDIFKEGTWEWVGSKQPINEFTDWGLNEPNNIATSGREDCLSMWADQGWTWNDEDCQSLNTVFFVCEVSLLDPGQIIG